LILKTVKFGASFMRFVLIGIVIVLFQSLVMAQTAEGQEVLEFTSDAFSRTRDLTKNIGKDSVFVFKKKPVYRLKRKTEIVKPVPAKLQFAQSPASKARYDLPVDSTSAEIRKQLGVTIWRLETETKAPAGGETTRQLVQDSVTGQPYAPVRVAADTTFKLGDKVRLSFESPSAGYLYVIDREIYADDKVGEPYQIFPTRSARGGDNRIDAGQVIDIPSQADRTPYFELKPIPDSRNWRGELLTIIVSPFPLTDMGIIDKPSPISNALVKALEDKYLKEASEYEQQGTEGTGYTKPEKEAGGDGKRQLTQGDPYPQTVYRVKTRGKLPMVISLKLGVR
jgi:hypothetical protein